MNIATKLHKSSTETNKKSEHDNDVSEIGITDTEIFAAYKDERFSLEYNKNNDWMDTLRKFSSKMKAAPAQVVEYVIKELNLKHLDNLSQEEDRNKASWDEIKSVSEAIELSKGDISVKGIITGKSEPSMVIVSSTATCWNCEAEDVAISHNPPLLLHERKNSWRCINCREKGSGTDLKYDYEPSIKIRIRDEDVLKDTELRVILYGKDCMDVEYGETVIIKGAIHVLQTHGKSPSLIPYTFSNSIRYVSKKEIVVSEKDKEANKKFASYPNVLERLVSMFAPNVIGEKDKKLALLRSMVNAQSDIYRPAGAPSSIINTAMIGDMGNAKTMLAKECTKVVPNSKYAGSQNSTGLSLTAMIDTENDVKILRYGVIPLAKHAICVINEFNRMDFEDQAHLLDVMSEKSFTISKYGTYRAISAPTTMVLTLNQSGTAWRNPDKVDVDEMPMLRALTDRVDQILISRDTRTKEERLIYAEAKREIVRKRPHNYNFLTKYLLDCSTIQPTFTSQAEDLINGFWKDMDKMDIGGGNRNLDSIYKIAEAHARLRLSDVVDAKIAKETLDHYEIMLLGYGKVVVVTEDIKKVCVDAITKVIKRTPMSINLEEAANYARMENDKVRSYLGDGRLKSRHHSKFREVYERFVQTKDRHINVVSNSPLTCIWQCDGCDECETMSETSRNKSYETSNNILEDCDRTLASKIKPHTYSSSHSSHSSHSTNNIEKIDKNIDQKNRVRAKSVKCPKPSCTFEDIHLDLIVHHIRFTKDHNLSLISKLKGGEAVLAKELGIKNKIKIANNDPENPKSYNGILILDVNESESGSSYIKHHYNCTECNFTSLVYDDVFRHISKKHFQIFIEQEYLTNNDYVDALRALDEHGSRIRLAPTFSDFSLEIARKTFIKYNSRNQRYFKKLLPSDPSDIVTIQDSDVPVWKNFIRQLEVEN